MYIALTSLNVDGELRHPGEPVPEAAGWKNLTAYLNYKIFLASSDDEIRATIARATGRDTRDVPLSEVSSAHEKEKAFWSRSEDATMAPAPALNADLIPRVEIDDDAQVMTTGRGGRRPRD